MMKNWIYIFIYFFTVCQYSHSIHDFDELIDILLSRSSSEDDPTDRIDVNLWNQFNEQDMKNMPDIDDYSNENNALDWLKWYSRVSLRYYQVKLLFHWKPFIS